MLTTIDPGSLRHQIQIQRQSSTLDSFGQPQASWTTIATAWAAIAVATQRELFGSGQLASQVTHVVTTRYQSVGLKAGLRVVYAGHIYQVQALNNIDQRQNWVKLLCLEVNGTE